MFLCIVLYVTNLLQMFQEDISKPLATVPGFIQHPPVILYFVVSIFANGAFRLFCVIIANTLEKMVMIANSFLLFTSRY
jgi:hypothetical protein